MLMYMHSGCGFNHNKPFDVCMCELEVEGGGGGFFNRPPTPTGQAASLAVQPI